MPLVDTRLIREMTAQRGDADAIVLAHDQGIEPLLGIYSKNCIKPLEESLFAGNLSVHEFLSGLDAKTFDYRHTTEDVLPMFFNINTPQDYSTAIMGVPNSIYPLAGKRH
jgi:molybdopterin-guanine dinucleotide biosynthesis protein A